MSGNILHEQLRRLKVRLLTIGLAVSAGWGIAAGILLLLLCMWLDLAIDLPPLPRILCTAGAALIGLIMALRLAFSAWRSGTPAALARRLDRATGAWGQILSGVDLLMHPVAVTPQGGSALTAGLARLAIDRASRLTAAIPVPAVAPSRPIYRPVAMLAFLALGVAIIFVGLPRIASTQLMRFIDPLGDHPPYSRVQLTIDPGDAKVVYGGTLDIRAKASGEAVESLDLVVAAPGAAEEALPMFPEPNGGWRATLTNVTAAARYYVRGRDVHSRRYAIEIVTVPKIQSVRFRLTPPAYTHRPPVEGPLPPAGISALPGTLVQVWAKSNRPLSAGTLQSDAPQGVAPSAAAPAMIAPTSHPALASTFTLAPSPGIGDEVGGSFVVQNAGIVSLKVADAQGQLSVDTFTAAITVLRDERPFVRILEPKPDSFATPDITLNVEMLAEDDYGVSHLQLFRGLNESRVSASDVAIGSSEPTRFAASVPLPLSEYAVSPGDVIKLYAHVEDNDPAGPKGSESPVVTVHVISNEQMQQMMLAREGLETFLSKYEQATRRMEAANEALDTLRKEMQKADPNSELARDLEEELKKVADQLAEDSEELKKMAAQDLPFDLDHALKAQLEAAAQKMQDTADTVKALSGQSHLSAGVAAQAVAEAQKRLGAERQKFKDEAADPLEHLGKIYPLIEDQARYIELYQRQRDLAQRMESLVNHDSDDDPVLKARMRDLETEQRQVSADPRTLLDDIESHLAQLPADERLKDLRESSSDFVKAIRASEAAEQLAAAESALEEFAGTHAETAARAAADTLEKFLSKSEGAAGQGEACLKFQPTLAASMGNTVQELLDAAGLSMSVGKGQLGAGGGYSARRSSLRNVGLYGRIPTRGGESRSAGGHASHGSGTESHGQGLPGRPGDPAGQGRLSASGQSDAAVPERYKRRVGEYFQRVSDELGKTADH